MRRKDRELPIEEAHKILEKGEWGVFCTFDGEYPYGVPVNYVFFNNSIYFHCATVGYKIDNLRIRDKVCFTVVTEAQVVPEKLTTRYESVIVFGKAEIIEGNEKVKALRALGMKFSKDYLKNVDECIQNDKNVTLVVAIRIEQITAKANRL